MLLTGLQRLTSGFHYQAKNLKTWTVMVHWDRQVSCLKFGSSVGWFGSWVDQERNVCATYTQWHSESFSWKYDSVFNSVVKQGQLSSKVILSVRCCLKGQHGCWTKATKIMEYLNGDYFLCTDSSKVQLQHACMLFHLAACVIYIYIIICVCVYVYI